MMKKSLRFWYDIVCPYAYLASTQVEALADELNLEIEWRPMLLGGIFRHIGAPQVPAEHMSPAKAFMNHLELYRWADQWGVPFQFSAHHPQRSVEAMRLLCVTAPQLRPRVSAYLYEAYWVKGEALNEDCLAQACTLAQLPAQAWRSEEAKKLLFEETALAANLGIFGAPTFECITEDQHGVKQSHLYWGQDRLDHVRQAFGQRLAPLQSRPAPQGTELILYHDFASPFSYLASTQVERIATLTETKLTWRPILLGALFKNIGAPNVPLFEMNKAKQAYVSQELVRWAQWWGVPFSFPKHFPLRTPTALRLSILEPSLIPLLYQLAWVEGHDIGNEKILFDALSAHGFKARDLLESTQQPSVKAQLREHTEQAQKQGVFGVPTFEIRRPDADPILLWGQDRISMLYEALSQSTPLRTSP